MVYGERFTGRIIEVIGEQDGSSTRLLGRVEVAANCEQRGLVGLAAAPDGELFASFTADDPQRRLTVARVGDGSVVWLGPASADRANGGSPSRPTVPW